MDDYRISKTSLKCLGRSELAFDFDLDDDFNPKAYINCPTDKDIPLWNSLLCRTATVLAYLIVSNFVDLYLLAKCFQLTKEQTDSIKSLLSFENFNLRKR